MPDRVGARGRLVWAPVADPAPTPDPRRCSRPCLPRGRHPDAGGGACGGHRARPLRRGRKWAVFWCPGMPSTARPRQPWARWPCTGSCSVSTTAALAGSIGRRDVASHPLVLRRALRCVSGARSVAGSDSQVLWALYVVTGVLMVTLQVTQMMSVRWNWPRHGDHHAQRGDAEEVCCRRPLRRPGRSGRHPARGTAVHRRDRSSLAAHHARVGLRAGHTADEVLTGIHASGFRGRGRGGFPLWRKLGPARRADLRTGHEPLVVINSSSRVNLLAARTGTLCSYRPHTVLKRRGCHCQERVGPPRGDSFAWPHVPAAAGAATARCRRTGTGRRPSLAGFPRPRRVRVAGRPRGGPFP